MPATGTLRTLISSSGGVVTGTFRSSHRERHLLAHLAHHRECHRLVPPSPFSTLTVLAPPVDFGVRHRLLKRMVKGMEAFTTARVGGVLLVDAVSANPAAKQTGVLLVSVVLVAMKQSWIILPKQTLTRPCK